MLGCKIFSIRTLSCMLYRTTICGGFWRSSYVKWDRIIPCCLIFGEGWWSCFTTFYDFWNSILRLHHTRLRDSTIVATDPTAPRHPSMILVYAWPILTHRVWISGQRSGKYRDDGEGTNLRNISANIILNIKYCNYFFFWSKFHYPLPFHSFEPFTLKNWTVFMIGKMVLQRTTDIHIGSKNSIQRSNGIEDSHPDSI